MKKGTHTGQRWFPVTARRTDPQSETRNVIHRTPRPLLESGMNRVEAHAANPDLRAITRVPTLYGNQRNWDEAINQAGNEEKIEFPYCYVHDSQGRHWPCTLVFLLVTVTRALRACFHFVFWFALGSVAFSFTHLAKKIGERGSPGGCGE